MKSKMAILVSAVFMTVVWGAHASAQECVDVTSLRTQVINEVAAGLCAVCMPELGPDGKDIGYHSDGGEYKQAFCHKGEYTRGHDADGSNQELCCRLKFVPCNSNPDTTVTQTDTCVNVEALKAKIMKQVGVELCPYCEDIRWARGGDGTNEASCGGRTDFNGEVFIGYDKRGKDEALCCRLKFYPCGGLPNMKNVTQGAKDRNLHIPTTWTW